MQRHVQNCNVDAEVRRRDSSVIGLNIDAMIGEQELWIESRLERPTLEYIGEESNSEPEHDCNAYDEGALLERGGGKDSTIKHENGKLD